jgi:DNA-binding response OmpR family regulator
VEQLHSGEQLIELALSGRFHLVYLDLRLPAHDGLQLCREIRAHSEIGIIITTSIDDPVERIIGLESGADGYFSKPLPMRELVALSKNLLKRVQNFQQLSKRDVAADKPIWQFKHWGFDGVKYSISANGQEQKLTHNECSLLKIFAAHHGQVLHRERILNLLHNRDWHPNDRSIDILVGRIRAKLKQITDEKDVLITQYGGGYMFTAEHAYE